MITVTKYLNTSQNNETLKMYLIQNACAEYLLSVCVYMCVCGHVQLRGYSERPLSLMLFIGTSDERSLRPHAFYQVHRVTGKMVTTSCQEKMVGGTKVLEVPLLPENDMAARYLFTCKPLWFSPARFQSHTFIFNPDYFFFSVCVFEFLWTFYCLSLLFLKTKRRHAPEDPTMTAHSFQSSG